MVCEGAESAYVTDDKKTSRCAGFDIVSKPEKKMYRINYTKR